jgi:hypothetical protein
LRLRHDHNAQQSSRRGIRPCQYVEAADFVCLMKQRLFSAFGLIERRLQLAKPPPLSLIGRPYVGRNASAAASALARVLRAASDHGPDEQLFGTKQQDSHAGGSYKQAEKP